MQSSFSTGYKAAYNRHRRRPNDTCSIGDLAEFIDFSVRSEDYTDDRILSITCPAAWHDPSIYQGPLFGIRSFPGFVYAPQALSVEFQRELAYAALTEFCTAPHTTNIDLIPPRQGVEIVNREEEGESMWDIWKSEILRNETTHGRETDTNLGKPNQRSENTSPRYYKSLEKLSWATLGYHYDWTARQYREDCQSTIPPILHALSRMFAPLTRSHPVEERTPTTVSTESNRTESTGVIPPTFHPSAVIVNYYSLKSTMGGHRDDLEYDFTKPVISISLGLPAVFLLGGLRKEEDPVAAILVRPGDVLLLGGASRLCYHGMARVISKEVKLPLPTVHPTLSHGRQNSPAIQDWASLMTNQSRSTHDPSIQSCAYSSDASTHPVAARQDRDCLDQFLSLHRININIRQVLPDGIQSIDDFSGVGVGVASITR